MPDGVVGPGERETEPVAKGFPPGYPFDSALFGDPAAIGYDPLPGSQLVYSGEGMSVFLLRGESLATDLPSDVPAGDLYDILFDGTKTPSGLPERFFFQVPDVLEADTPVPLVVIFHRYGSGPIEIFNSTSFPQEVNARGWFFLAPTGGTDVSFSSLPSQLNIEWVLDMVLAHFGKFIDEERIYGIGFSMGGGSLLNYAARHVDPTRPMFAAAVNHTGTLALKSSHANNGAVIKSILEFWFGGTPAEKPFEYERSSVVEFDHGTLEVMKDKSFGRNLTHLPILDVRAEFDPNSNGALVVQNEVFEAFMEDVGGQVTVDVKEGITIHNWSTLDEVEALDFLAPHRLKLPTSGITLTDRDARYFHFDVSHAGTAFGRFVWSILQRPNRLTIRTNSVRQVEFSPLELGLDLDRPIVLVLSTEDGSADDVSLRDFSEPPVAVLRDSVTTSSWTHDPVRGTLTLKDLDPAQNVWEVFSRHACADVRIGMEVSDSAPLEQAEVVYTLKVRNFGPVKASGVTVQDLLPAGVTFVDAVPSKGSYDDQTGTWSLGTLDYMDTVALLLTASVDVGTGGSNIDNSATVGAAQVDDLATNNAASSLLSVDPFADLEVALGVDEDRPLEGANVVYTLQVTNLAPGARATTVSIVDLLPAGLTFQGSNPSQGLYDDPSGLWTIGMLNSGGSVTLEITASVDLGTVGNTIVNTTTLLSLDQPDPNATNDSDSVELLVVANVDLALTKDVDDPTPNEKDQVVYTVGVLNTNATVAATSVTVEDLLPSGVTYASSLPSHGSYDEQTGVWTLGTLAGGASATLEITVDVDVGTGGTLVSNTATILGADQPDPNGANDSDSVDIDVDPFADLAVTKDVDDATPLEGDSVEYTITVSNPLGAARATGVVLTDLLPAGVAFQSAVQSQGGYDDQTGIWTVGTLDAGTDATLELTVLVEVGSGGDTILNTATLTAADQPDPNAANDSDSAQIDVDDGADLAVSKTVDVDKPKEGDPVVFTITVENPSGGAQASGVSLSDQLPVGLTFSTSSPSQGSYDDQSGVWTIGTIDAGANAVLELTALVDVGTVGQTLVNTANGLVLDQTDPNAANDSDSASVLVVADVDLALVKVVDDATPAEGQPIVYTLTLSNTDPSVHATGVLVTDVLPAGVTFVLATPSQGGYDDQTGVWTVGTLNATANATLDLAVTVDVATGGQAIVNGASVTALDQPDPNAANDSDSAQIDVENVADLSLDKDVDDATPAELQEVVYTLTVENPPGGAQATGVVVTDLLPAGVSFVSAMQSQGTYDDQTGEWTVGTLDAGTNATLEITAGVDAGTGGDSILNSAAITGVDQIDPNALDDSDGASITVDDLSDLAVLKVADDATPKVGAQVVFTITVSNPIGGARATGVSLTDVLPAGVTYGSDTPSQGSFAPGTGVWTVGTLDAGASANLELTVTVDVGQAGQTIVNTTSALVLDQTDPNAANDVGSTQLDVEPDIDLEVTLVADDDTPDEAQVVVYTLTVTNNDPTEAATGVSLIDLLPAGVGFDSDLASQGTYSSGTGVWLVGTIPAGNSATLELTVTVDLGTTGQMIVNATSGLTSDQTDPVGANDADSVTLTVN